VELPNPEIITELQFQSPPAAERGAAVAAGGAPMNTPTGPGFPRGFRVEISADGNSWQQVTEGASTASATTVTFNPVSAKFVRITLTTGVENGPPWSIQSLKLYRAAKP
jgi:F5/8 type C domain-containing protein